MSVDVQGDEVVARRSDKPRLFRGLPVIVWALCGLMLLSMLNWSFTRAVFSAQDERAHVGAVLYLEEFREWPGFKEMPLMLSVMRAAELMGIAPFLADDAVPRSDRPSFAELTDPSNLVSGKSLNQMSQHPPLYYAGLAAVHRLVADAGLGFDLEIWLWRALSALILCPLPLLAAALARRLGAGRRMTVLAAATIALLPSVQILGGAVNNDNLLIAASGWVLLGMGCVLTGDLRVRTAVWIGLALAVALLTKAFAIPIAVGVAAAYLVVAVRTREVRRSLLAAAVVVAVAALGGWWWVRNLLIYGAIQPNGHSAPLESGPLPFDEAWPIYWQTFVERFFTRYWLGANAPLVGPIEIAATIVLTILVVAGLVTMVVRARLTRSRLVDFAVLLVPIVLASAIVVYQSYRYTVVTGVAAGVQGRYLFPAALAAGVVFAVAADAALKDRGQRILLAIGLGLGLFATVWRVGVATQSWEPDASSLWEHLSALYAWSPLPYPISIAIQLAWLATFVLVAVLGIREVRRPAESAQSSGSAALISSAR
ncbi:DUF2142 domain-containing protein [Microbacterium sp. NPDC019599]|uniref:DUF2142 domain-containing protein n=1 Tax=Microbacterium sp. NPDC019599 TaxID=3154690 RepID=UPI0033DD6390